MHLLIYLPILLIFWPISTELFCQFLQCFKCFCWAPEQMRPWAGAAAWLWLGAL